MTDVSTYLGRALGIFAVSVLFFHYVDVPFRVLLITAIIAIVLLIYVSWKNLNKSIIPVIMTIVAVFLGYSLEFILVSRDFIYNYDRFRYGWASIWGRFQGVYIGLLAILASVILFVVVKLIIEKSNKKNRNSHDSKLLLNQEKDMERLGYYIDNFESIGMNGEWGSGKTFLTDMFIKENKNKYDFIKIGLLDCDLDEIQNLLLSELDRVLSRGHIFSVQSLKIKKILNKIDLLDGVRTFLFPDNESYLGAIREMKELFKLAKKPVVIIFEDIDRISDIDIIKKLFSIAEQLTCEKIKVLYQYAQKHLTDMDMGRDFTEKYIPYIVNLTSPTFFSAFEGMYTDEVLKEWIGGDVANYPNKEDFDFLAENIVVPFSLGELGSDKKHSEPLMTSVNMRKLKRFICEVITAINEDDGKNSPNKRLIISFYLIKHFYHDFYEKLSVEKNLFDIPIFLRGEEVCSIRGLYNNSDKPENVQISESPHNIENYKILCLLYSDFQIDSGKDTTIPALGKIIMSSDLWYFASRRDNLIREIYAKGTMGLEYFTFLAESFTCHALSDNTKSKLTVKNFHEFDSLFKKEACKKGVILRTNSRIRFENIFDAFNIVDTNVDKKNKLVDFYLQYNENVEFDKEFFEIALTFNEKSATYTKFIDSFNRMNPERIWRKRVFGFSFLITSLDTLGKKISEISDFLVIPMVDSFRGDGLDKDKYVAELLKLKEKIEALYSPLDSDTQRIIDFIKQSVAVLNEQLDII
ncbi:MAG: P-loop NTPase fold protein [Defluviitaleaceae bacterium]|nr:P-loop NTPase fold protein [Defluviitaleaceae bacterium]MCL2263002.1 P-loop NTPase fold protein [Defluviitaleaceae bacterium]